MESESSHMWFLSPVHGESIMMSLVKPISLPAHAQSEHTWQLWMVRVLPQQLPQGTAWGSALKTCPATGTAARLPLPAHWGRRAPKSPQTFICKMSCMNWV